MAVEIQKNAAEVIRVEATEYNGIALVAVRVWLGVPGTESKTPTKKGLTLRPETWRKVIPAILELLPEETDDNGDDETDTTSDHAS